MGEIYSWFLITCFILEVFYIVRGEDVWMVPKRMKQVRRPVYENILNKNDRKASQGYVDVKSKTIEELEELIERQNKLLQNRSFLAKLPDKGKKIISFKGELENELKKKQDNYNSTCYLFSDLTLNDSKADDFEWSGGKNNNMNKHLDSDDDDYVQDNDNVNKKMNEIDPLNLIATHSGTATGRNSKNISSCSIRKDSLKVVKDLSYVNKVCEKYGKATEFKNRFKPNQLKANNKDLFTISAEKLKKRMGDKWEVTQATPPVPIFKDAVIISLSESLKLQNEQAERLKEIEKNEAAEKLLKNMCIKMGEKLPFNNVSEYRENNIIDENEERTDESKAASSESEDEREVPDCYAENDETVF